MRKIAIAMVATLCLHGMTAQAPQKKKPAPAPAQQSTQQKLTPAQMADLKKKMAAAMEKAKAEMNTKIQAKLAADQLKRVNETHQRFTAMMQQAKPAAHQAIQTHMAKIQSAIEELNRTKAPIAMEKYFPKAVAAPASTRNNRAHDSDPVHHSQRQSQPSGPTITKIQVYPAAQGDKVGNGKLPSGQPGDPIHILGSGFGNTQGQGTVTFLVSNGQSNGQVNNQNTNNISTVLGTVILWSDNEIYTSVPNVSGIGPFPSGVIMVTTSGGATNSANFNFRPTIMLQPLTITMSNVAWSDPNCPTNRTGNTKSGETGCQIYKNQNGANTLAVQMLFACPAAFCSGVNTANDVFFSGYKLINGWALDSIILIPMTQIENSGQMPTQGQAQASGQAVGSISPTLTVHSSIPENTNPTQSITFEGYNLTIMIHGPSGVPYQ